MEFKKCYKGRKHRKHKNCVHIDASTSATLLNRYLGYSTHTLFDYWTGKPKKQWGDYQIQWKNIAHDLKRLFSPSLPQLLPRVAFSLAAFIPLLWGNHELAKTVAFSGAVAFDTATSNGLQNSANQTSVSTTHTAGGSNRYAYVGLSIRKTTNDPTGVGCTYDSVSMSTITSRIDGTTAPESVICFGLTNPNTTTSASVAASWTNGSTWTEIGVVTFTGVLGGAGTPQTFFNASTNNPTLTVTTPNGTSDMIIDTLGTAGGTSATAGQTQRWKVQTDGGNFLGAGQTATGGTNITMSWTTGTSDNMVLIAVPILATAPTTTVRTLGILGVGT